MESINYLSFERGACQIFRTSEKNSWNYSKILNEQLKALEEEKIVERIVYPEVPPRVEYKLTEKGLALLPALEMIEKWAEKYLESCSIE